MSRTRWLVVSTACVWLVANLQAAVLVRMESSAAVDSTLLLLRDCYKPCAGSLSKHK
jgi:hypothetical protein